MAKRIGKAPAKRARLTSASPRASARQHARRAEALLHDVALTINSAIDLDTILSRVVELSMELVHAEAGTLALLSRDRKQFISANTVQMPEGLQVTHTSVTPNVKQVIRTRRPLILNHYPAQPYAHPVLVEAGFRAALIAPVLVGDEVLGVLTVCRRRLTRRFYQREAALLVNVAQQAGVAIANARRYEVERQRVRELEALRTTMADISAKIDLSVLVPAVVQRVVGLLGAQEGALALYEPASNSLALLARHNVNSPTAPMTNPRLGEGLLGQVALLRQPLIVNDYQHWPYRRAVVPDPQLPMTALGVPLLAGEQLIGALAVYHFSAGRPFDANDVQLLSLFAQQVTSAVQNAQLYQAAIKDSQQRALLYLASQEIGRQLDLEQLYLTIHQTTQSLMLCDVFVIALIDRERNELEFVYLMDRDVRVPSERRPLNHGLTGYAILNGESLRVDDFSAPEAAKYNAVDFGDPTETTLSGLVALMRRGGQVLGALSVQAYPKNGYTDTDLHLLELLAANAAIAIENARLYRAALLDAEHRALLYQASQEISGHLRLEPLYAAIHRAAQRLMPCQAFVIALLEKEQNELHCVYLAEGSQRYPEERQPKGDGLLGYALRRGESWRIDDFAALDAALLADDTFGDPSTSTQSGLIALMRRGGEVIGLLSAQAYPRGAYSAADLDMLELLAANAAIAIESARLYQAALKDAERRAVLYQASQEISGNLDLEQLYTAIHHATTRLMPCDAFIIGLLDESHSELEFTYLYEGNQLWPGFRGSVREGLIGYVIGTGASRRIDDLEIEEQGRFVGIRYGQAQRVRAALVALMRRGGHVIGAIAAQTYARNVYTAADLDTLELLAANAAIALDNARLFSEVQGLATVDELTGVWNRRQFFAMAHREMERMVRYPRPLAILLLDADHFKRVNDTYGHHVGDQVLRALATRCLNNLRDQDMLGRYGGEEFVILLPETDDDGAEVVAERLCSKIAGSPVMTTAGNVSLTASLGLAHRSASDTYELEELLNRADKALYRAKHEGRNRVVVWEKMTPPAEST